MSLENYIKTLDFILKNPAAGIGILGGEPTLHPDFSKIIQATKEKAHNRKIQLFTNGIELKQYLPQLEDIQILINYNNPKNLTSDQFNKLQDTLETAFQNYSNVIIGCNIYLDCEDYDYIWDIVSKYNLTKIRCSVVSPGGIYKNWRNKKDEYFTRLKPIYLKFCENAIFHNCKIEMDCSYIPLCYFNTRELTIINMACSTVKQCDGMCISVLDFTTDLKVQSCFGISQAIDYEKFSNTRSLGSYMYNKYNKAITALNNTGKCKNCTMHNNLCQGGCLAFANCPE